MFYVVGKKVYFWIKLLNMEQDLLQFIENNSDLCVQRKERTQNYTASENLGA